MIIIQIHSGLGNQMLTYAAYIVMKKLNPDTEFYFETFAYDIPECGKIFSMWNGMELTDIFGIKLRTIKELFNENEWNQINYELRQTKFWDDDGNWRLHINNVLNNHGLTLINRDRSTTKAYILRRRFINKIKHNAIIYHLRRHITMLLKNYKISKIKFSDTFFKIEDKKDRYIGPTMVMNLAGYNVEAYRDDIKEAFQFPILDDKNKKFSEILENTNSVAIHSRRGDLLFHTERYYKCGYFKRAVKYIKKNIDNPVFVFFGDPGTIEWCKNNEKIFALNFKVDKIYFVDWNKGKENYKDMQLMSICKHNIITDSSFGWWGAFLNDNPNKITCSPEIRLNTTHHF